MTLCAKHKIPRDKRRHCLECDKEYWSIGDGRSVRRKYEASDKGKETRRKNDTRHARKLKERAQRMVQYIIRKGKLTRLPCLICGISLSEAHHAWGYEEEHRLHVVFLCAKHHRHADKNPLFNEELKEKSPLRG